MHVHGSLRTVGGACTCLCARQVVLGLANVCCSTGDYPLAITHLEQLVHDAGAEMLPAQSPPAGAALKPGWQLLSMLGRLHLQVGNLEAAGDAFDRLECLALDADRCAAVRMQATGCAEAASGWRLAATPMHGG